MKVFIENEDGSDQKHFAVGYQGTLEFGEITTSECHPEILWVDPKDFQPEDYFKGGWLKGVQEYLEMRKTKMSDKNIKILRKETYLKAIENSVGSKLFNSLLVEFQDSGETTDILNDGMYSCAFFISSILYLLGAIDKPHTTVKGILEICENNQDWTKVEPDSIEPGDLIFWEKIKFDDSSENAHVGFALNDKEAVSTDYKNKVVARHPIISDNKRAIEAVYRYTWLDVAD